MVYQRVMTRAGIINQIEDLFRSRGLGVYRPSTFPGDPDKNEVLLRGLVEEGLLCSCVDFVDMEHFTLSKEWRTRLMGASENEAELARLRANAETQKHIDLVRKLLRMAAVELLQRGEIHDQSKFAPEEVDTFARVTPKLKGCTFGSEEYKGYLEQMQPALRHHYANNRHHPEFHENGINGMNIIDLLEMYIDWLASSKRHDDGDIFKSIEVCAKRFDMSPQLVSIFQNTARAFTTEGLKQVYSRQWRTTLGLPEKGPVSFAEAKKAYDELMKEYGRDPKAVRDLNAAIADAEKAGEAW